MGRWLHGSIYEGEGAAAAADECVEYIYIYMWNKIVVGDGSRGFIEQGTYRRTGGVSRIERLKFKASWKVAD